MELNGDVAIAAPRARVWAALNDPDTLARCIEGVESLVRVAGPDGERLEGKMNAKVGPVRATFAGHVTLMDVVAPERYRLVGEGKGGVAGFAKGEAAVALAETGPNATLLSYKVTSSVGGKLAQLGARLIEGTAKGYATSFFERLKEEIEVPETAPETLPNSPEIPPVSPASADLSPATGLSPLLWGGGIVLIVLAFLAWQWL
ncbi:MAG: hypothetical protein RL490_2063 [Pseudomonadota bacterium]|jgi:carbon monoxide dehydrogenase subunit G